MPKRILAFGRPEDHPKLAEAIASAKADGSVVSVRNPDYFAGVPSDIERGFDVLWYQEGHDHVADAYVAAVPETEQVVYPAYVQHDDNPTAPPPLSGMAAGIAAGGGTTSDNSGMSEKSTEQEAVPAKRSGRK